MAARSHHLAFLLVLLLLCSWHLDAGTNDNIMARAATVASLVDRGTLEITPIHEVTGDKALVDGRYYSDKAPLPAFIVLPFHALAVWSGLIAPGENGTLGPVLLRMGGLLCGSLALATIMLLVYIDLHQRPRSIRIPVALLATLPFLGSFLFVYSGSFNAHTIGALFVLLAFLSFERGHWAWCGLWGGAAVLCEYPLAVFSLWWGLVLVWRTARGGLKASAPVRFALGGLPALAMLVAVNIAITGEAFTLAYAHEANYTFMKKDYGIGLPTLEALAGLTASTYRGLFFYMPVAALALVVLVMAPRKGNSLPLVIAGIPMLLCFLVIASYGMWWGGWAYGPRHLAAVAVLLTLFGLRAILAMPKMRWPFVVASAVGLVLALAAKSTVWYSFPTGVMDPMRMEVWPRILKGEWTTMQWPVLLGLSPGFASALFLVIFAAGLYALVRIGRATTPA